MRKLLSIIMIAAIVLSLAACNAGNNGDNNSAAPSSPSASVSPSAPESSVPPGSNTPAPSPSDSAPPSTPSQVPETPSQSPPGGNGGESGSALSGSPEDILAALLAELGGMDLEMPMSSPPMPVAADASQNTIGLSEADFNKYVVSAVQSMAMIGTFAHQIILIQGTDDDAAAQIKKLVSSDGGYDSKKWVCVYPEKTVTIDSGVYVLIAAAKRNVADAAVELFKTTAGTTGEVIVFWEHAGD